MNKSTAREPALVTAPFGMDERGEPIEEVITTASRLPPPLPWSALFTGIGMGVIAFAILDDVISPRRRR